MPWSSSVSFPRVTLGERWRTWQGSSSIRPRPYVPKKRDSSIPKLSSEVQQPALASTVRWPWDRAQALRTACAVTPRRCDPGGFRRPSNQACGRLAWICKDSLQAAGRRRAHEHRRLCEATRRAENRNRSSLKYFEKRAGRGTPKISSRTTVENRQVCVGPLPWDCTSSLHPNGVPRSCKNRRKTAVSSGHPRVLRTTSNLGTCKLTPA